MSEEAKEYICPKCDTRMKENPTVYNRLRQIVCPSCGYEDFVPVRHMTVEIMKSIRARHHGALQWEKL